MTLSIMAYSLLCWASFMLNVIYAECHKGALYAECRYPECHYTECRYTEWRYAECRYAERHGALFSHRGNDT
jgi:hypothetical protein